MSDPKNWEMWDCLNFPAADDGDARICDGSHPVCFNTMYK
jgi:hypothetical protein